MFVLGVRVGGGAQCCVSEERDRERQGIKSTMNEAAKRDIVSVMKPERWRGREKKCNEKEEG